jgi:hypothetical protein
MAARLLLLLIVLLVPGPARGQGARDELPGTPASDQPQVERELGQGEHGQRPTRAGRVVPGLAGGTHLHEGAGDDFTTDEQGRTFRVRFDPASRVRLGVGQTLAVERNEPQRVTELLLGLSYRSLVDFGEGEERIRWQLDQQVLPGRIRPGVIGAWSMPVLDATLYQGSFLRHTAAPYMLLPTSPPRRLFFPFDLGVEVELGRARLKTGGDGEEELLRLGVAHASLIFDPWRSGRAGNSLELGLGLGYDLDLSGGSWEEEPELVHRLAPFTHTSVRLRLQGRQGLSLLDLRGDLTPCWVTRGRWQLDAEVRGRAEQVLIAVNDQPVGAGAFRLMLGLELGLQLR